MYLLNRWSQTAIPKITPALLPSNSDAFSTRRCNMAHQCDVHFRRQRW